MLHSAVHQKDVESGKSFIKFFILHGSSVTVKNLYGHDAYEVARRHNPSLLPFIEQALSLRKDLIKNNNMALSHNTLLQNQGFTNLIHFWEQISREETNEVIKEYYLQQVHLAKAQRLGSRFIGKDVAFNNTIAKESPSEIEEATEITLLLVK